MPNWCSNSVIISGDKEILETLVAKAAEGTYTFTDWQTKEESQRPNVFSFDNLVPTPKFEPIKGAETEKPGEFVAALNGNTAFDYSNSYNWHVANWGTKWDLAQDEVRVGVIQEIEGKATVVISYETAWSPASAFWVNVSSQYPIRIEHRYVEEGCAFIGEGYIQDGVEDDFSLDLDTDFYKSLGLPTNAEGEIDWELDHEYDLWDAFPLR